MADETGRLPAGAASGGSPVLAIEDLHVYYGHAHALQGVSLTLDHGVLAVVGRNGMGKTTLCNAVMGLTPARGGSVRLAGREILGREPSTIVGEGVSYVPQGRRVWPSLSVDEHLRLAARSGRERGSWTVERVYAFFPRLTERRRNGGAQLSGGEQQMLAIGRALLSNPRLIVMDEPTEGLAPVVVRQVADMLRHLAEEGEISVLLIEQNLGVALDVAETVGIMVNGRIVRAMPAAELAHDPALQQRLLGVRAGEDQAPSVGEARAAAADEAEAPPTVIRVRRRADGAGEDAPPPAGLSTEDATPGPTRWSQGNPAAPPTSWSGSRVPSEAPARATSDRPAGRGDPGPPEAGAPRTGSTAPSGEVQVPVARIYDRAAYVVGTFDTKGRELEFVRNQLRARGLRTVTVDLSTGGKPSQADVTPKEVARHHPNGADAVFTGDRGAAVAAMAEAFAVFLPTRRDLGGVVSAGGSGGTALATPAMRRLPVGTPKVMVSTVASGNTAPYVGPTDICMMYSVTDVQGLNSVSERILANAANALAGMIAHAPDRATDRSETDRRGVGARKPAVGLTMFGVTTPCVQAVVAALEDRYDCLVFHATGTGGQSMEKLADSGMLAGLIDVTTTEIADLHMGGVFSAGEDRLGAAIRTRLPYVGSCGALDMVNWGAMDTVPDRYRARNLYAHNPQVTLMRTTAEENAAMGAWIAERLNRCEGPVRFLIPEGGVSLLDAPGQPFHDPAADAALFRAVEAGFRPTSRRRLIKLPYNLNEPPFAAAVVEQFLAIAEAKAA